MKKIFTLCLLLFGIVFLAGCGQKQTSQTQPTTPAPGIQQPAPITQPINEAKQTECEKAGGKSSKIKECDGSESEYCQLNEKIYCYADMVKNGKCEGVEFSEKSFVETGDGMVGPGSGPRVLCDNLKP